MQPVHPIALFRLSVLGQLASRERFERGELSRIIRELATHHYDIPHANRSMISAKTIERWFHLWQQTGIEGLTPKQRSDRGHSKLSKTIQALIIGTKQDNPRRSTSAAPSIQSNNTCRIRVWSRLANYLAQPSTAYYSNMACPAHRHRLTRPSAAAMKRCMRVICGMAM